MGVKQDYLMRMINDVVRGLALVLTGQREVRYELPKEQERTEEEKLYARILEMADRGEINEAENILLGDLQRIRQGTESWWQIFTSIWTNLKMIFWKSIIIPGKKSWKGWRVWQKRMD